MSGTTRVSRYQRGKTRKIKTNLDLLEQETVSGNGICWAICKSAPHPRQPWQHPTTQFFTGRMPFLPPNQQRQGTEEIMDAENSVKILNETHRKKYAQKTAIVMKISPKTTILQVVKITCKLQPEQARCYGKSARLATLTMWHSDYWIFQWLKR